MGNVEGVTASRAQLSGPWRAVAVLAYLGWAGFLAADTVRRSGNVPLAIFVIVAPLLLLGGLLLDRRRRARTAAGDRGPQEPTQ